MITMWPTRDLAENRRFHHRTVEPTDRPVTDEQVSAALDLGDDDSEVDELADLIEDAVAAVEIDSNRSLMPQTWEIRLDRFPDEIEFRRPPIRDEEDAVVIEYLSGGSWLTLDSDLYQVDSVTEPPRIRPVVGTCWPATDCAMHAVKVTVLAGYADCDAVPKLARRAVLLAIKALYRGCAPSEAYWSTVRRIQWGGYA